MLYELQFIRLQWPDVTNKESSASNRDTGRYFLDITQDICPLTFVKTKLLLERMVPGTIAEIRLNAGEPLENIPRSVQEEGHKVLSLEPEADESGNGAGPYRLLVQKA